MGFGCHFFHYIFAAWIHKQTMSNKNLFKMKKVLFLAGLCALGLCTFDAQAGTYKHAPVNMGVYDNHIPSGAEKIVLKGKLDYNAGPDDIEAGATQDAVYLYFGQSFGYVSVSLYSPEGHLVHSCVVDTSVQQYVTIPVANNSGNGAYYLALDAATGFAEGEFEKNPNP